MLLVFRGMVWLYEDIKRGQVFLLYPIPHGVYLSLYRILYSEPAYLCAVVSKTLIFLTFSLFCQNSSTYSDIIYYLSDTCIIQSFTLWNIPLFLTGFHVIKIKRNKSNDCFWPFPPVLVVSGMAGEKTAHRPPSRLAPSPPSKIKAPWRFFTRPGKNPSLSEIPYQSPKKCLKTQITTFSILKFSPKTKNTPVLTVFTLFLLF